MPKTQTITVTWYTFKERTPNDGWKIFVKERLDDPGAMYAAQYYNGKVFFEACQKAICPDWEWFYASELEAPKNRNYPTHVMEYASMILLVDPRYVSDFGVQHRALFFRADEWACNPGPFHTENKGFNTFRLVAEDTSSATGQYTWIATTDKPLTQKEVFYITTLYTSQLPETGATYENWDAFFHGFKGFTTAILGTSPND